MTPRARARSWSAVWQEASTGPDGFWRRRAVAGHFATPAGPAVLAEQIAARLVAALRDRPQISRVIEVGAGDATLLGALRLLRPDLRYAGCDIRSAPPEWPSSDGWLTDVWDAAAGVWTAGQLPAALADGEPTMIVAVEWLDEIPVNVLSRSRTTVLRQRLVDDGWEVDGDLADPREVAWARRWWPTGDRVEVGRNRDRAWADLVRRLSPAGGAALMIDYGHRRAERPARPALRAYADGRERAPVPDGRVNLTADVAVDAVAAAGERFGARTAMLARLAEVFGFGDPAPARDRLADLSRRSARSALASTSPHGFGRFWWLLQDVPATGGSAS